MNTKKILEILDKHAREFNFPVLDNTYIEFAAARLSAYLSTEHWLIIFEVLGFSNREIEFVDDVYAYGSCLEKGGFVGEEISVASLPEAPLFDGDTNQCLADWSHWVVSVQGKKMVFSPSRGQYEEAGIQIARNPGTGTLREIELLRFLVHVLGVDRLSLDQERLLNRFPQCRNMREFVRTANWQHPDIAAGEKPSENSAIRSLVEALSQKDPSVFEPGRSNTDWKFWDRKY